MWQAHYDRWFPPFLRGARVGDIEVILANLRRETGRYRMSDLLPLPFDRRQLRE